MIQPPKRAVTRFFIPLIDVLILLFCIFLLMPFAEKEAGSGKLSPGEAKVLRDELDELRKRAAVMASTPEWEKSLREQIEELKKREAERKGADRVFVRTFQIDSKTGELSYLGTTPDGGRESRPVRNDRDADALIDGDESALKGTGQNEILYVIRYPSGRSLFPTPREEENYREWFRHVKLRLEDPGKKSGEM